MLRQTRLLNNKGLFVSTVKWNIEKSRLLNTCRTFGIQNGKELQLKCQNGINQINYSIVQRKINVHLISKYRSFFCDAFVPVDKLDSSRTCQHFTEQKISFNMLMTAVENSEYLFVKMTFNDFNESTMVVKFQHNLIQFNQCFPLNLRPHFQTIVFFVRKWIIIQRHKTFLWYSKQH